MSLPTSIHPFLITGNDANQYKVPYSLRFRKSASANLTRTFSTPTSGTTWTWSAWMKRGALDGVDQFFFSRYQDASNISYFRWSDTNILRFYDYSGGVLRTNRETNAVFRDPSAWYHVVLVYDSNNATAASRARIYVNNVEQTYAFSTNPNSGQTSIINASGSHQIGSYNSTNYLDGYLAEVNFIDGQALTPSSFGYTDNLTNQWVPKKYTGSYGTNGFYLPFKDNSSTTALGYDVTNGTGALTTPYAASIATNNSGWDTLGVRMLLTTGAIQQQGKSFRITLKSGSNGLNIQGVKFGVKASSGNAWDFTGDQVSVTFGGATTYSMGTNATLTSDWMVYPSIINPSSDYILALAVGTTNGTTLSGSSTTGSIRNYTKAGDYNSGALTTAPTGYSDAGTAAYFLTALEVQGNNWTPSGISVTSGVTYDSMRDSPTGYDDGSNIYNRGNYPTLRILRPAVSGHTYSNGNLTFSSNNSGSYTILADGQFPSTGKYYFEIKFSAINAAGYYAIVGVGNKSYTSDGVTGGASWNTTNTIGIAIDCDNSTFQGYKDGVAQTLQTGATVQNSEPYFSIIGSTSTFAFDVNFGQRPFSYTPPTRFKALNSFNLPNPSLPLV